MVSLANDSLERNVLFVRFICTFFLLQRSDNGTTIDRGRPEQNDSLERIVLSDFLMVLKPTFSS